MALDLSKVKSRLESLKTTNSKSQHLWKPNPGKNVVRIVPYKHNPENPFIELLFHYGINNKTYLSPASFNRPDPIIEFANKLKKTGDKEEWKEGRKLEPKMRTYVPVLVRGAEAEGVKFWGMGKQVYQEILSIISDADYGDITDVKTGRDIVVDFKTAEEAGKSFPETTIRVKPNQTVAFDPTDKAILEKFKDQKNILELFPELSYEELSSIMTAWLNAGDETATPAAVTDDDATATPEEEAPKTSPVAASGKKPATSAKAVADEFDDLFSDKKK